ncbi:MAG TPA: proton-conducting transporter membrane subunit [Burkholderiales bacterium]|nr:proton-conducting transporter membrane subunit [Burkholderiales bacterium]
MSIELILPGCFAALALAIGLYSISVRQGAAAWWLLAGGIALAVVTASLLGHSWTSTILLDVAELAAVALVRLRGTPEAARAARLYLYSIVPAIACTLAGLAIVGTGGEAPWPILQKLAVCLLVVGFALKLGLVPFYFWLPEVAAKAAPMTAALVISLVDIATFSELAGLREIAPWIFERYAPVWTAIALISMAGGALLALAQSELKRMLAFSSVTDLGLLLLGVVAGGVGLTGAWVGALNHALSKVLLFGAVGIAAQRIGRPVTLDTRGLAKAMPLASAAFVIGAFGLIGVPPGFGFAGYWRLYTAAAQYGGPPLIACLVAVAALDLLCYARAIHRTWYGSAPVTLVSQQPAYLAGGVLTCLAVGEVLLGLWPDVLTGLASPVVAQALLH